MSPKSKRCAKRLEKSSVVLDAHMLAKIQVSENYPIGAFQSKNGNQTIVHLAYKVAKRIARRAAPHDQQEAEALAAAWYFVLWTEMCSITPIRHLARRIHKRFGEQYILIPIEKKKIHCLNFWQKNDLEPIVLAYELWRRDANVFLYKKPKRNWLPIRKMRRLTLEFAVKSRFWGAKEP
ncbi:MAG: hypothetical protein ABJN38_18310, partial [Lentilitoribacter sp.]